VDLPIKNGDFPYLCSHLCQPNVIVRTRGRSQDEALGVSRGELMETLKKAGCRLTETEQAGTMGEETGKTIGKPSENGGFNGKKLGM